MGIIVKTWVKGITVCLLATTLWLTSCATVGRDFPSGQVTAIKIRQTTRDEVQALFGKPWRVGIEDGHQTWTYGKYRYSLFGDTSTKDLIVRFDEKGIVTSYSYNETQP
jgi:hypothetical protein